MKNQPNTCPVCRGPKEHEAVRCSSCDRMPVSWRKAIEDALDTALRIGDLPGSQAGNDGIASTIADDMATFAQRFAKGYRLVTISGTITPEKAKNSIEVIDDSVPDIWNFVRIDSVDGDPKAAIDINDALFRSQKNGSLVACHIDRACGAGLLVALGKFCRYGARNGIIGDLSQTGMSPDDLRERINSSITWRTTVEKDGSLHPIGPVTDTLFQSLLHGKTLSMEVAEAAHLVQDVSLNFEMTELKVADVIKNCRDLLNGP